MEKSLNAGRAAPELREDVATNENGRVVEGNESTILSILIISMSISRFEVEFSKEEKSKYC